MKKIEDKILVKKRRISIASAKQKGRILQQYIGKKVAEYLDVKFGPDDPVASRPLGCNGTDIIIAKHLLKRFPFSIEAKNCEKWNFKAFIEQAKKNVLKDTSWALVIKRNHEKPIIVLDFDFFMEWIIKQK